MLAVAMRLNNTSLVPSSRRAQYTSLVTMAACARLRVVILLISSVSGSSALQNLFPKFEFPSIASNGPKRAATPASRIEGDLIAAIQDRGSRLFNSDRISDLISQLEASPSIPEPAIADQVYGRWRLIYTTNTDTSSPIQRKAVDSQAFPIYQDIVVEDNQLMVKQVVQFSDKAYLTVDALASTAAYPLAELTDRKSSGKVFGINVLGVSLVGEEALPDPSRPNSRIDFVFDEGYFDVFGSVKVPYPVPFRLPLLRDWVKGWIDITFLSDKLRISRGNKGTTFVLVKED